MSLSYFDEASGIVPCETNWGRWWQTVHTVFIDVNLPEPLSKRDVSITIKPSSISVCLQNKIIIEGRLRDTVHADEALWTLEDNGRLLSLVLPKAEYDKKDNMWKSLLANGSYEPDYMTLNKMREKLDLEQFQIENPGMNFSNAKLSKTYDKPPGIEN